MPYQPVNPQIAEQIAKSYVLHPPKEDQPERYEELRAAAMSMSMVIARACPPSRERALAMTKLEETVMWASKSIAVNE